MRAGCLLRNTTSPASIAKYGGSELPQFCGTSSRTAPGEIVQRLQCKVNPRLSSGLRKLVRPAHAALCEGATVRPEVTSSASSPRSSSVGRIGSAHLANQQPYQARHGDGPPRVLLNPSLDIAFHSSEFILRYCGGLRQAVPGSADNAGHLVPGRGDLFLSEVGNGLGQFSDVFAQTG